MKDGDKVDVAAEANVDVKGNVGVNVGGVGVGGNVTHSEGGALRYSVAKVGDMIEITAGLDRTSGTAGGGNVSAMGVTVEASGGSKQTEGTDVVFRVKPDDPEYQAVLAGLKSARSREDLATLATAHRKALKSQTDSESNTENEAMTVSAKVAGTDVSVGVGGSGTVAHKETT